MALDRQKILNDLGSVMTQLKNADCGCMGKLFGGAQSGHGGCHGGHLGHHPCPSEPFLPRLNLGTMNPPKLYAETFNYLNKNLMQPTIKEVYDELKSINNMNTVMNNPSQGQAGTRPSPAAAIKAQLLKEAQNNLQKNLNPDMAPNTMGISGGQIVNGNMNNVDMQNNAITNMAHVSNPNSAMIRNLNIDGDIKTENVSNSATISGTTPVTNRTPTGMIPSNAMTYHTCQYSPQGFDSNIAQTPHKQPYGWGYQYGGKSAPTQSRFEDQVASTPYQHRKYNQIFPGSEGLGENKSMYDPMTAPFQMNPASKEKTVAEAMAKSICDDFRGHRSGNINLGGGQPDTSNQVKNLNPSEILTYQQTPDQDPAFSNNHQNVKPFFGNESQNYVAEIDYNNSRRDTTYPVETIMSSPIYNTIGQPVTEHQITERSLNQTISTPYTTRHLRNDPSYYSSVKNTVSKTSLMGTPGNAMGNRNQLNHLYNQYKGSQSYTHQALKPPVFGGSMSVGHLNTANTTHGNVAQIAPVEKLGGDTVTSNFPTYTKPEPVTLGGDVVATPKVHNHYSTLKEPCAPKSAASRNGLQDVAFTTYNTAPAWSFYRNSRSSPFPAA